MRVTISTYQIGLLCGLRDIRHVKRPAQSPGHGKHWMLAMMVRRVISTSGSVLLEKQWKTRLGEE